MEYKFIVQYLCRTWHDVETLPHYINATDLCKVTEIASRSYRKVRAVRVPKEGRNKLLFEFKDGVLKYDYRILK